jgi:glycosyltransferase involved in cell wall biosynthesis
MKGKNILIASCVFPPEPVVSATISFDLANYLANENEVTVISPKPTRPLGYNFDDVLGGENRKFKHVVVNSYTNPKSKILLRFYESYSLGKHIVKYIKANKHKIDIVYINSWPLASQYLIIKVCKKLKIETVIHIQDIYPETLTNKLPVLRSFFHSLLLPIDQYILTNASKIVTISLGMKNYLLNTRNIEEKSVKVVYNWQNIKKSSVLSEENKLFTFVYLGSLSPSAQIESIIEAFGELEVLNARLIIAGSGSDEEKLKTISANYLNAKIEFIPAPSDQVVSIQSKADVLVLSLREGVGKIALPSKLVSYMFSKKPILAIVEQDCDIEKIIIDAECGWVVKQNAKEEVKSKMLELIDLEKSELINKGEKAEIFATNNLSREVNLEKLAQVITNKA